MSDVRMNLYTSTNLNKTLQHTQYIRHATLATMHFINAAENTHHNALKCNKIVQMQQM